MHKYRTLFGYEFRRMWWACFQKKSTVNESNTKENQMNMNRRMFFKSMGAATVAAAPISSALANVVSPKKWDQTCEVLVIGAGAAGLFAAVSAKESGAKSVVLLEKAASPFLNSTSLSAGSVNATGTKAQFAAGVEDRGNAAEFAKEVEKTGKGLADPQLVKIFAENSAMALDWLTDHGVVFTPQPNSAFRLKRMHGCDKHTGAQYVDVLFQNAKKIGVDIKLNTKVVELITNTEANEVLGVKAESKGKPLYVRATKGVVIATGGFCGDVNMIDKFILDFRGALTFASANSEGQGLKMAEKIGAASTHMNFAAVYGYGVPMSKDKNNRKGWIFRGHVMNLYGPITVGPDGKRFVNDDLGATSISQAMSHLGFKKVFQVATEAQLLDFMKNDPIQVIGWDQNTFKKELEEQKVFVVKADTIAELAKKMGLPADQLEATVKRYNQFVKNGKDEDFGRKYMKGTFEKGPFYGFIGQPIAGISLGGLKVNKDLQVLDVYDQPIKHLYAAGEAIGGIHGGSYIGGNSVGSSLTLGMVAGKKAAASK